MDTVERLRSHWTEYVEEIRSAIKTAFLPCDHIEEMVKIFLEEHPTYEWRSVAGLARECDCPKEDVERVIEKFYNTGIVVQSTRNDDQWGLLTRIKEKCHPSMWNQKGQFNLDLGGQKTQDMYTPDYYKNTNVVIDPGTFQPCPTPCPAPAPPGYKKTHTLESKEITVPYAHVITPLTKNDMFTGMNKCLSEVNQLIAKAEHLNKQLITSFS